MPDAYAIFKAASTGKQESVKLLWPELYQALAGLDRSGNPATARVLRCCFVAHADTPLDRRPEAVGRASLNGTPVCATCLGNRPLHPLKLVTRRP